MHSPAPSLVNTFATLCSEFSHEPSLGQDCTRLSEGTVVARERAIERAEEEQKSADRMPQVMDEHQYNEYTRIREMVGLSFKTYHDGAESEVFPVITMERLQPLHTLTGQAFVKGWVQLMRGMLHFCACDLGNLRLTAHIAHYLNWCNGIQHKDISLNNLMYRRKPDNTLCAVLNDWDLSSVVTEGKETCSGFELTGTVPFMAIDLLSEEALAGKIRHLYRHDLESFIWVFLWVVHCCLNGQKLVKPPFEKWSTPDVEACGGAKLRFLFAGHLRVKPTASWTSEYPLASASIIYLHVTQQQRWRAPSRFPHEELKLIEEEDLSVDVWKGFLSVVRDGCEPELHYLLDLADLELE